VKGHQKYPSPLLSQRQIEPQCTHSNILDERMLEIGIDQQVRAYLSALQSGRPSTEYAELAEAAREEWPALKAALGSAEYAQDHIIVERYLKLALVVSGIAFLLNLSAWPRLAFGLGLAWWRGQLLSADDQRCLCGPRLFSDCRCEGARQKTAA